MPREIALLRDIDNYEHIRAVFLDHEHCSLKERRPCTIGRPAS